MNTAARHAEPTAVRLTSGMGPRDYFDADGGLRKSKRRRKEPTTTSQERALESEAEFQSWVISYARARSWLVAHVRDSRKQDAAGLPDLVLCRAGLTILAELKSERGKTTPAQDMWLSASGNHLWRPSDRKKIEAMLW